MGIARRCQNCLHTPPYLSRATFGRCAYFEWIGEGGTAVGEIVYEGSAGWRLETLLSTKNTSTPQPLRKAVYAELARLGVHLRGDAFKLVDELERAARRDVAGVLDPSLLDQPDDDGDHGGNRDGGEGLRHAAE